MDALQHIVNVMRKHITPREYDVFVFGSRATGQAGRWSDYDIGIRGTKPLPPMVKAAIEEELEESDLPYTVEIVDFYYLPDRFRSVALSHIKTLPV